MRTKDLFFTILALCLGSCSSGGGQEDDILPPTPEPDKPLLVKLNCKVDAATESRATDYGFEQGDAVGIYMVDYQDGVASTLQPSGNHADNLRFTYDGTWTPGTPLYWTDDHTKADFYLYYPYAGVTDIHAHAVNIPNDQSTEAAYKQGDFLWGKTAGASPTEQAVSITAHHVFSAAVIHVKAGNGFTEESLAAADVSVHLNGLKRQATVDLTDGSVSLTGEAATVIPLKEGDSWKAIVAPQSVTREGLVSITVDGREYRLTQGDNTPEFTFKAGKRHTFTITVSKTSSGVNVNIGAWEDDGTDHGGVAE